jgi:hypothetical protein
VVESSTAEIAPAETLTDESVAIEPPPVEIPAAPVAIEPLVEAVTNSVAVEPVRDDTPPEPMAIAPPAVVAPPTMADPLEKLDQLQLPLALDIVARASELADLLPVHSPIQPPTSAFTPPEVREEYRELRDHLLSRFTIKQHTTWLFVDAGRTVSDCSWLMPLAVSLIEHLTARPSVAGSRKSSPPQILLVEAAGANCEIARGMGLDVRSGLAEVLRGTVTWQAALQATMHPQIQLLSRGMPALKPDQLSKLTPLLAELEEQFDVLLIAGGPVAAGGNSPSSKVLFPAASLCPLADAAILCLELDGTPQQAAQHAKQALIAAGANLLGCVVRG